MSYYKTREIVSILILCLLPIYAWIVLPSCGDGSGGKSSSSSGATPTIPGATISFKTNIQPIFESSDKCAKCHNASVVPDLSTGKSYSSTVDKSSSQLSCIKIIASNSSDNSFLIKKLEGTTSTATCGTPTIPDTGIHQQSENAKISSTELQTIKDWINQGAQNN